MEKKRAGRPIKTKALFQVGPVVAALLKIKDSPVEDMTAEELVVRYADVFDAVFANNRSPAEIVRKLKEELELSGIWRGTEAELHELIATAHRECRAKASTAGLSQPEPPLQDPNDQSGTATAGEIGEVGGGSTPNSTIEQTGPAGQIDVARRTTGLPDAAKPHRATVISKSLIASAKATDAPSTSQSSVRSVDSIEAESKHTDPAANGGPVAPGMPTEEGRGDDRHDSSEAPLSEVPKDVAAQIAKGLGLYDANDGYESFGSTDSG